MKVITINVCGIRASQKKGLFEWLKKTKADFICMQETRALEEQIIDSCFTLKGYSRYLNVAEKKGYSGVAIYTKNEPLRIEKSFSKSIFETDYNIAHTKDDIKNWKSNQKNSGFLPEERKWMTKLIDEVGMKDAFREKCKRTDVYTWWSNRGNAYNNNVGWRIDYQMVTSNFSAKIKSVSVYKKNKFSDHAPLIINYDI